MATKRQEPDTTTPQETHEGVQQTATTAVRTVQRGARPFTEFVTKFQNDWSLHLAQALAFSLLTAIIPIVILLLAIVGAFLGTLNAHAETQLINNLMKTLPPPLSSHDVLQSAIDKLNSSSGFLAFIAIVFAVLFGSRLFTLMEVCFDVIYQLRPRRFLQKNLIAIAMLILFIILIPVLALASTVPGVVASVLQSSPINPNPGFLDRLGGIISSLLVSFVLFEAFYVFIPNRAETLGGVMNKASVIQRMRASWMGAAVAAVALQILLIFFPLYVQYFMKGYVGQIGLALVLLAFFYLFAVILLLGAEVNAFFAEGIRPTRTNLITRANQHVE